MKRLLILMMILLVSILTIGGCGMEITNPQVFDHIKEANGATLRCKLIDIGVWNMDLTSSVDVLHGLTSANIISYFAEVYPNNMNNSYPLTRDMGTTQDGYIIHSRIASKFVLYRNAGGYYDGPNFDDGVMNRGTVFIWYID